LVSPLETVAVIDSCIVLKARVRISIGLVTLVSGFDIARLMPTDIPLLQGDIAAVHGDITLKE
jgi:hypothetical protein